MPLSLAAGLTLYFCRHGETEANVEKRFQGRTCDTPLTPKGREQSRTIAHLLKAADNIDPLRYVSSPLARACTTMEIILAELGLPKDGYRTDARLQEIDLGIWDGLTDAEARALDPAMFVKRGNDKWDVRVPGGEDYADVAARAESWIASLSADTLPSRTVRLSGSCAACSLAWAGNRCPTSTKTRAYCSASGAAS